MPELTEVERVVLRLLLSGDDTTLVLLRDQLAAPTISSRKLTGVGFYTHFSVPEHIARTSRADFEITDVCANVRELSHGAGFVLFVRNGTLSSLEGFTYGDEAWPEKPAITEAYWVRPNPPGSPRFERCEFRDTAQLLKSIRPAVR